MEVTEDSHVVWGEKKEKKKRLSSVRSHIKSSLSTAEVQWGV